MFNKGTLIGLIGLIEKGGQVIPLSTIGDNDLWKKAQKNPKKNMTSEKINSIIPNFKPTWTILVCLPIIVLSRTISRHQRNIIITIVSEGIIITEAIEVLNQTAALEVSVNLVTPVITGQNLSLTICQGINFTPYRDK